MHTRPRAYEAKLRDLLVHEWDSMRILESRTGQTDIMTQIVKWPSPDIFSVDC